MDKNEALHGDWVILGEAYAGSLATWFQHEYPNKTETNVTAVWASSAPLLLSKTYSGFDMNA